jgi:hypothetical protein
MGTKVSSGLRVARGVRSVEVRVEHGDSEAPSVEERRELEHGVEVAQEWQGEEDNLAAGAAVAMLFLSGHCRRQSGVGERCGFR